MASLRMGVLNLLRLGTLKEDGPPATFRLLPVAEAGTEDANLERPPRLCMRLGPGTVTAISAFSCPDGDSKLGVCGTSFPAATRFGVANGPVVLLKFAAGGPQLFN